MIQQSVQRDQILSNIKSGKHTIIYGSHGIGKNYTVNAGAKQLGITIIRVTSADDLNEMKGQLLAASVANSFVPIMFVFQDAENIQDFYFIEQLVQESQYPVFLVMNTIPYKMTAKLKAKFEVIRFQEPRLSDVVAILKTVLPEEEQLDFSKVTTDIRQSLLNVRSASETYSPESTIEELEDLFLKGIMSPNLEKHHRLWLLIYHNIGNFYLAPDIVGAFEILQEAALYDQPHLLTLLPRGRGKATFPKSLGNRR